MDVGSSPTRAPLRPPAQGSSPASRALTPLKVHGDSQCSAGPCWAGQGLAAVFPLAAGRTRQPDGAVECFFQLRAGIQNQPQTRFCTVPAPARPPHTWMHPRLTETSELKICDAGLVKRVHFQQELWGEAGWWLSARLLELGVPVCIGVAVGFAAPWHTLDQVCIERDGVSTWQRKPVNQQ